MQGSWMTNVRTFSYMNNIDKVKAAVCPFCVFKFLTAMPILCHVKFNKGKNKWYFDGKTWFCTESLIITQTDNIPYNTLYNESLSNSDLNNFFSIKIILSCLKSKHWTQYCTSPKETMSFKNLIWNYPLQAFRP